MFSGLIFRCVAWVARLGSMFVVCCFVVLVRLFMCCVSACVFGCGICLIVRCVVSVLFCCCVVCLLVRVRESDLCLFVSLCLVS